MKKEELVSKFMDVQHEYQMTVRNAKGKKRFAFLNFFANNIGGRVFSGSVFGTAALLAAAPLGIFALIPMAAGLALGFFVPKIIEKINLSLMGKFGKLYTKHYLANKAEDQFAYYLICQKNLVNAENLDNVSKKDWKKFCEDALSTHYVYDSYLWEALTRKIDSRRYKDTVQIKKIMNNSHFDADTKRAKVEKILAKHEKALAPWCELKNECGKFAANIFECAKEFNPQTDVFIKKYEKDNGKLEYSPIYNTSSYFDNAEKLRKSVYDKYDGFTKLVKCNMSALLEEPDCVQKFTDYTPKDKENGKEEEKGFDKEMLN